MRTAALRKQKSRLAVVAVVLGAGAAGMISGAAGPADASGAVDQYPSGNGQCQATVAGWTSVPTKCEQAPPPAIRRPVEIGITGGLTGAVGGGAAAAVGGPAAYFFGQYG
jgi:hypothetical protein